MTVAPQEPEQPADPVEDLGDPVELSKPAKYFVGTVGLGLLGVGSWALIGGTDGAGSVAVFIAGVILICLAAAGVLPQKVWGKDMGLILRKAVKQAEKRGEDAGRQEVASVVAANADSEALAKLVAATRTQNERAAHAIDRERLARESLQRAAMRLNMRAFANPRITDDGVDALVEDADGSRYLVRIALGMIAPGEVRELVDQLIAWTELPVLLVGHSERSYTLKFRRDIAAVSAGRLAMTGIDVDEIEAGLKRLRDWRLVSSQ